MPDQVASGDAGVAGWISAELQQNVIQPIADFQNPDQEWRRLFSELLGTFFLVMVAAGGGMMGAAFPNTISRTAAVVAPGLMVLGIIHVRGEVLGRSPEPGGEHRVRLRPRASRTGSAPRPRRAGRRTGLHLRPIRLPRSGDPRVPLGPERLGVQRRVPPHLADRDVAEDLEPR